MSRVAIATLITMTSGCVTAVSSDPPSAGLASPIVTARASCSGLPGNPDRVCSLTVFGSVISIASSGKATVLVDSVAGPHFLLPFKGGDIEGISYAPYEGDVIVLFEVGDGESGWGGIVRLQPPDFSLAWHVHIPTFNVGAGALEGSSLYLSGLGFVARVDVAAGHYVWKHEGLYDQAEHSFNNFDPPVVTPSEVLFHEDEGAFAVQRLRRPPKLIRARKLDGVFSVEPVLRSRDHP